MGRITGYVAGLDLGQTNDYTAFAILEVQAGEDVAPTVDAIAVPMVPKLSRPWQLEPLDGNSEYERAFGQGAYGLPAAVRTIQAPAPEPGPAHLLVRYIERMRGWPYPQIVRHVVELMQRPPLPAAPLVLDRTGCGRPVFDMFMEAGISGGVVGVSIHGGDQVTREEDGTGYRVPKRDLAGALQVLFGQQRLQIAQSLPLASTLEAEILNFKAKISTTGHDSYEAGPASDWREGQHDDLVLCVAMACWYADRPKGARMRFFS